MFPQDYFPDAYFTHHYWAKVGAQPTGGVGAAGRRYIMAQAMMEIANGRKQRSLLLQQQLLRAQLLTKAREEEEKILNEFYNKQKDAAIYSALLSEV